MKIEKRKPDDMPQCPYCKTSTPMYSEMGAMPGRAPAKGDVCICLMCSGVALFTGEGIVTRKPSFEEKHALLASPAVVGGISMANHYRHHHM